jgi:hypothetical protein
MKIPKLITLALVLLFFATVPCTFAEEHQPPSPQVIILADQPKKCAWFEGINLAQAILKTGGTSASNVYLVRRGLAEKIKIIDNLDRKLEPWDILVIGYQPPPSPSAKP